jgi:ABC-type polysaccharide/polyol phosphate export permease
MVLAVLLTASLISCSVMLLITSLVKSSAAIGVINGVAGTFFGFLCGIYMPYSSLGESTKVIGSLLPFTHLVIWLKQIVLDNAFSQLGIIGEYKNILYRSYFSADSIGLIHFDIPLWTMVILSGFFGLICLAASYSILFRRFKEKQK